MSFENIEIEKVILDILQKELNLPDNYGKDSKGNIIPVFVIGNQNINLGATEKLQIAITVIADKISSNINKFKDNPDGGTETTEIVTFSDVQVDLFSKSPNNDARTRRYEALAALNSTYSKQQQAALFCRIFQIPTGFLNTSAAEGGSQVTRYSLRFRATTLKRYTKDIDYYNQFPYEAVRDGITDIGSNTITEDTKIWQS